MMNETLFASQIKSISAEHAITQNESTISAKQNIRCNHNDFENQAICVANMSAQIWMHSVVLLVLFVSLNGKNPHGKSVIVKGNNNVVSLGQNKGTDTAFSQILKKLESLDEKVSFLASHSAKTCKFDFEYGIRDWEKTGTAFNNQPTYGDNPTARNRGQPANQQGDWWIGGAEDRPSKSATAGRLQGDAPQGTLTSPYFKITGGQIAFLIGGGCNMNVVRAELIVGNKVVQRSTGKCHETMTRESWNVQAFIGQQARVKLVDFSSGGWGHINFDDLKGDISCL